jgi:hypothetical protein
MNNLKALIIAVLNAFEKGQGATKGLSEKLIVCGLTVSYLNNLYIFNFKSEAHKDAYLTMLLYKELKDKSPSYIERLFKHLGSGEFLSLNHTDGTGTVSQVDKYAQYKPLFISLGITECRSNGKGSKLVQLLIDNPNEFTVTALVNEGFNNISPLLDGFKVIGLKCELPKTGE